MNKRNCLGKVIHYPTLTLGQVYLRYTIFLKVILVLKILTYLSLGTSLLKTFKPDQNQIHISPYICLKYQLISLNLKEMKVNWATTSGGHQAKLESSSNKLNLYNPLAII